MQDFSKYRVSRMLDTKDINRSNALGGIFEYTTHLTNLELPCFYIRLWMLVPRFVLVCSRKYKLLATLFYLVQQFSFLHNHRYSSYFPGSLHMLIHVIWYTLLLV